MKTNLLRAAIAKEGKTQSSLAEELGMSPQSFSKKIRKGAFGVAEAEKMVRLLNIENPSEIFLSS